jgi:uncharacterized protein
MMSNKFIKDPHEVVKAGDVIKVKVLEVDVARKRVALTMRLEDSPDRSRPAGSPPSPSNGARTPRRETPRREPEPQGNGAMAEALARALKRN